MCRNRKHNRADFPFLKSVCKASSQLPLLLFLHCLLSKKSLSNACVCMWSLVRSCPLFHLCGLKYSITILFFYSLLCSIRALSCYHPCLPHLILVALVIFIVWKFPLCIPIHFFLLVPLSVHWPLPTSFWTLESVISKECVSLHILKMTHAHVFHQREGEPRDTRLQFSVIFKDMSATCDPAGYTMMPMPDRSPQPTDTH